MSVSSAGSRGVVSCQELNALKRRYKAALEIVRDVSVSERYSLLHLVLWPPEELLAATAAAMVRELGGHADRRRDRLSARSGAATGWAVFSRSTTEPPSETRHG